MPTAIAVIAGQVASWVSGAVYGGLTALGVSTATASLVSGYAASLAVVGVYATAYLAPSFLVGRPDQPGLESAKETSNQTRAPRRWGMGGQQRLGGTRLLFASIRNYGLDVVYHCEGPATPSTIWLHDDEVTVDGAGVVQPLSDGAYGKGKVSVHGRSGAPGQTAIAELVAVAGSLWTSAHKAVGCAITGLIFRKCGDDDILKIYPRGRPKASRLMTFGIYDFRKDSTVAGGDGPQRRNQPATWGPCANPVIGFIHNELHRYGADWERRFLPTLEVNRASANYCDGLALKYDGGTEARYAINGSYASTDDRAAVRRWFLECMDGSLFKRPDGSIEVRPGRYEAPTFALPTRHIVSVRKVSGIQKAGRINVLTGSFCSPAHAWTEQQATAFRDEADIALRGEVADQLPLTLVASHDQWRRLAYRRWLRRRMGDQLTVVTNLWGLNWDGSRWITLPAIPGGPPSLAVETEWEVLGVRKRWPLQVEFTLAKSTGEAIDAPLTGDLAQPGPGVTALPPRVSTPVPELSDVSSMALGAGAFLIRATVDAGYSLGLPGNRFALRWRLEDEGLGAEENWETGLPVLAPEGVAPLVLQTSALTDGAYEVAVQAIVGGYPSDWSDPVPVTVDPVEAGPIIVSYAQSSSFGGAGVAVADVTNMQDGLAEPFAATDDGGDEWVQAILSTLAVVASVTLKASTATGGWGAAFLNGRKLQGTVAAVPGPSSTWTDIATLSGFTDGSEQTVPVAGAYTALRLLAPTGYLAIGEFTVA